MLIISYFIAFVLLIILILLLQPYLRSYFPLNKARKHLFHYREEFAEELDIPSINYDWKGTLNHKLDNPELPQSYEDNRLVLLVRNPTNLYAYWELSSTALDEFKQEFSVEWPASIQVLRVYGTDRNHADTELSYLFDIQITRNTNNWFFIVPHDNSNYMVELGQKLPNGKFIPLLRSRVVKTPRSSISSVIDENWIPCNIYNRLQGQLYGLSSGWLQKKPERKDS